MNVTAPVGTESSTPAYGCDCITLTNEALKAHNCELDLAFEISRQTGFITTTVALRTILLEKKRGAKALNILASFCPFCGNRYEPDDDASRPPAETPERE